MSDINTWVSDQLHDMLQLSDRSIAEYLVGLCRKSDSPETFLEKIRETETIDINESVRSFSRELWGRIPRELSAGEKRRLENRRIEEEQRYIVYRFHRVPASREPKGPRVHLRRDLKPWRT